MKLEQLCDNNPSSKPLSKVSNKSERPEEPEGGPQLHGVRGQVHDRGLGHHRPRRPRPGPGFLRRQSGARFIRMFTQ